MADRRHMHHKRLRRNAHKCCNIHAAKSNHSVVTFIYICVRPSITLLGNNIHIFWIRMRMQRTVHSLCLSVFFVWFRHSDCVCLSLFIAFAICIVFVTSHITRYIHVTWSASHSRILNALKSTHTQTQRDKQNGPFTTKLIVGCKFIKMCTVCRASEHTTLHHQPSTKSGRVC